MKWLEYLNYQIEVGIHLEYSVKDLVGILLTSGMLYYYLTSTPNGRDTKNRLWNKKVGGFLLTSGLLYYLVSKRKKQDAPTLLENKEQPAQSTVKNMLSQGQLVLEGMKKTRSFEHWIADNSTNVEPLYLHHCGYDDNHAPIKLPSTLVAQLREPGCTVAQALVLLSAFMQPGMDKVLVTSKGVPRMGEDLLLGIRTDPCLYYTFTIRPDWQATHSAWESCCYDVALLCQAHPEKMRVCMTTYRKYRMFPHHRLEVYHDKEVDVSSFRNYWQYGMLGALPIQYIASS